MIVKYSRNDLREIAKASKGTSFDAGFRLLVYGNSDTSHLWAIERYGTGGWNDPWAPLVLTLTRPVTVKELKEEIEDVYSRKLVTVRWKA